MFVFNSIAIFYLVILLTVVPICKTKEAISCFYNNIKCKSTILSCDNNKIIIINDIYWYMKQQCTQDISTCKQCCIHDVGDTNQTISSIDNIEIYKICHRTTSCDPFIDLQPPENYHNGYIYINYTCQQGTSGPTDKGSDSNNVVYAIVFPILGLCIIVCVGTIYLCFLKQRKGLEWCHIPCLRNNGNGKENVTGQATSKPEEIYTTSSIISGQLQSDTTTVNDTNNIEKDGKESQPAINLTTASQNVTKQSLPVKNTNSLENNHVLGNSENRTNINAVPIGIVRRKQEPNHTNLIKDTKFTANAKQNNQAKHLVVDETKNAHTNIDPENSTRVKDCGNDNIPCEPRIVFSQGVTECDEISYKCSPKLHSRIKQHLRQNQQTIGKTEKRKIQRSRKQQLLFLKNVRLLRKHFLFDKNCINRDDNSSSEDYSPSSTVSDESLCGNEEIENKQSFTDDTVFVMATSKHDAYKPLEVAGDKDELKTQLTIGNYASIHESSMPFHGKSLPDMDDTKIAPSIQAKAHAPIEISDKSSKENDYTDTDTNASLKVKNVKCICNEPIEITPIVQSTTRIDNQAIRKHLTLDESHKLEHVHAEGPLATSSFRYTKACKPSDNDNDDTDATTKGINKNEEGFELQSEISLPTWCIPKPPATKLALSTESTETVLNRSMSLNESDSRRSDVISRRRKRKYESMRHAKRETIFDILQKLEAVPKRSILKKSKSMHVTKQEIQTIKRVDNERNTEAFIDDTNLTDSDKIHQLSEPIGVTALHNDSECTITDDESSPITSFSGDITPFDDLQNDTNDVLTQNDTNGIFTLNDNESLPNNVPSTNDLHEEEPFSLNNTGHTTRYDGLDTFNCGIISSNLRENSHNDKQDSSNVESAVDDGEADMSETAAIPDEKSVQKQASVREKLLQKSSSDTLITHEGDSLEELSNQSLEFDERGYSDRFLKSSNVAKPSNDTQIKTDEINNVPDLIYDIKDTPKHTQQKQSDMSIYPNDGDYFTADVRTKHTWNDSEIYRSPCDDEYKSVNQVFKSREVESDEEIDTEYNPDETHNRLFSIYHSVNSVSDNASYDGPAEAYSESVDYINRANDDLAKERQLDHKTFSGSEKLHTSPLQSPRHLYEPSVEPTIDDSQDDDKIPERPKTSHGMRSRVAEMYNYYQQQQEKINRTKRCNEKDTFKPVVTYNTVPKTTYANKSPIAIESSSQHYDTLSENSEQMNKQFKKKTHRSKKPFSRSISCNNPPRDDVENLSRNQLNNSPSKLQKFQTMTNLEGLSQKYPTTLDSGFGDNNSTPRKTPRLSQSDNLVANMNDATQKRGVFTSDLIPPPDTLNNSLISSNVKKPSYSDGITVRRSKSLGPAKETDENPLGYSERGFNNRNSKQMNTRSLYSYSKDQGKNAKKLTLNDLMKTTKKQTIVMEHATRTTSAEPKRLLNRRSNNNYIVQETRETGEVSRERPTSALPGRHSNRNKNGTNLYRNKSMSNRNLNDAKIFQNGPRSASYSQTNTGNYPLYERGHYSGNQRALTGWSRWDQRTSTSNALDRLPQPSPRSVSPFDEYDSELEKFFENSSDEGVLKIDNKPKYDHGRTNVSRSKSWKT